MTIRLPSTNGRHAWRDVPAGRDLPRRSAQTRLRLLVVAQRAVCATLLSAGLSAAEPDAAPAAATSALRIDQLQVLGTHNSYHVAPDPFAMQLIAKAAPREAASLDCTQRPLGEQLALGLRHFELDVYLDPDGQLFRTPMAYAMAQRLRAEVPPFDPEGVMAQPGIKVLHSPDFDYRTTVLTLQAALQEIRKWSDARPNHVPIFLLIELKDDSFSPTRPLSWNEQGFQELEQTILAVWPRERILAPDDVRGEHPTLREAVSGRGWPKVDDHRGKVAFLMDNEGAERDRYLQPSEILANRLLFTSVAPSHPAAAWMKRNDPLGSFADIQALVRDGFLVRTRADSSTVEARRNDGRRRDKAIASGAQLISTDFPEADQRFSNYRVELPPPPEMAPLDGESSAACRPNEEEQTVKLAPGLQATPQRSDSQVDVVRVDAGVRLDVRCARGIGRALLTRTGDQWPQPVTVRCHLRGLEELSVALPGRDEPWIASRETYRIVDPQGTGQFPLGAGATIDVTLPAELWAGNPREVTLQWIDFYR